MNPRLVVASFIVIVVVVAALSISRLPAGAQGAAAAAPSASPAGSASPAVSPSPAPTDPPVGPGLRPNDSCNSISAIVGRPSQTTSVCTVRPNRVLIETGYQNTTFDATSNVVVYPQTFIRVGTSVPNLEVDIAPPSYSRVSGAPPTTGFTDAGGGLKYVLGFTPKLAYGVNVLFSVPTGANGISAGGTNVYYNLNGAYTLNSIFSVASTLGVGTLSNGSQKYTSFTPSIILGASLPNGTGLFAEVASFSNAIGPNSKTRTQYIVGVTRALTPRVQIDLEAGRSPTAATGKYRYIGGGVSVYF